MGGHKLVPFKQTLVSERRENCHWQSGSSEASKKVDPAYPGEAAAQHISGTVRVYYVIGGRRSRLQRPRHLGRRPLRQPKP